MMSGLGVLADLRTPDTGPVSVYFFFFPPLAHFFFSGGGGQTSPASRAAAARCCSSVLTRALNPIPGWTSERMRQQIVGIAEALMHV
jgi:hypothetical protein